MRLEHELKWFAKGDKHGRISLDVELQEERGIYVSSEDVPGLHLILPVFGDNKRLLESAIKRLFAANKGLDVALFWRLPISEHRK